MSSVMPALDTQGTDLVQMATTCVVTNDTELQAAGESLRLVKAYLARVEEVFGPIVAKAHAAHKEAVRQRDAMKRYALDAEIVIKGRMAGYQHAQEVARRAEAEAAAAKARQEEETRRLEAAVAAERAGDGQAAARILDTPAPVVVPPVAPAAKVEGVSFREDWTFEITDAALVPREYLAVDEKKIGGVVRAMKGLTRIPGVRVYARTITSVRA